jgi:hypothetical protein
MNGLPDFIVLHELATASSRVWHIRRDAITAVVCVPSARGVDAEVYVQGFDAPIRPREQGDDILCEIGVFLARCRACLTEVPGADRYGGICPDCRAGAVVARP